MPPRQAHSRMHQPEADRPLEHTDVAKAVSDMQKDELIHQYQYFVGQDLAVEASQTPSMRGAEDFSL